MSKKKKKKKKFKRKKQKLKLEKKFISYCEDKNLVVKIDIVIIKIDVVRESIP